MERLDVIATKAEQALPGILALTNRLNTVLSNLSSITAQAETLLGEARPIITNVAAISSNLRNPKGSLGEWALPTNLHVQLLQTLQSAETTLTNASSMIAHTDTNLVTVITNIDQTLVNLGNITSNLNQQVQSNTNLVKSISDLILHADDMIQGLKRHWFLRSAFKTKEEPKKKEEDERPSARPAPKAGKWRQ
jgi:hypothetical protein